MASELLLRVMPRRVLKKRLSFATLTIFAIELITGFAAPTQLTTATSALSPVVDQSEGRILVSVTFDQEGNISECHIVRSNAPFSLEVSTVQYIRKHWALPAFAGITEIVPIVFSEPGTTKYWDDELMPPPDLFPIKNMEHRMKLRLTFDLDGWVRSVSVVNPSDSEAVDRQTATWIKAHWHHTTYSNKVIDVPFDFLPPPLAPAPKPIRHAKPLPPPEPVAIPAVPVQ